MTTALVQSASTTWAANSQGGAKTITLSSAATVGDVVIVEVSYQGDIITSVSGLGATWTCIQSREGSNADYPSAEIWYGTVTSAGTTITVTPNPSFTIYPGKAVAREFSGLAGTVTSSSTVSSQNSTATRACPSLSATAGQVYVGVATQAGSSTATSLTQSPGSFAATENTAQSGGGNDSAMVSGCRIAAGSETVQLTGNFATPANGLAVAAVFDVATTPLTISVPAMSATSAMLPPVVTLTTPDLTITAPPMVATATMFAPRVLLSQSFAAYDLDANSSQALRVPIDMSATLEADPLPATLPSRYTDPQLRARRLSLIMPTPSLDSRGRPT